MMTMYYQPLKSFHLQLIKKYNKLKMVKTKINNRNKIIMKEKKALIYKH